uniref:hypothetical protein n=1 Tax=Pseudomonas syringae TaxID=317 RepID=UPI001E3BD1E4|nr:hypothetical protein [Pseudomonas syringae]QOQ33402.1 hypothetical protein [Pseudomonas syringae pv. actinidiae]
MQHNQVQPSPFATESMSRGFISSDWRASVLLLALPFIFALVSFVLAVAVTLLGEMDKGSTRFYTAAFSYSFLLASVIVMPSYLASFLWYGLWSKNSEQRILKGLWIMPLIAAAVALLPAILFFKYSEAKGLTLFQVYLLVAIATLIIGYFWSCVVRVILRVWRKI